MLTFDKFTGMNNVATPRELGPGELTVGMNVDCDTQANLRRRSGYAQLSDLAHHHLFASVRGFTLATRGFDGDLVRTDTGAVLQQSLGPARVWYADLPDGRIAFSNGSICGLTDGSSSTPWGVPLPASLGGAYDVDGGLAAGNYRYALSYVRASDGLEGGLADSQPVPIARGGLSLLGLPQVDGYSINVYLTGANGAAFFLAGNTADVMFAFTGVNSALQQRSRTDFAQPAPAGRLLAFWRTRVLVAVGNVLYASQPHQPEHFDLLRDLKQFSATLTLVQPVESGIFVGTEEGLAFLEGKAFDTLALAAQSFTAVALGSGVTVDSKYLPARMSDRSDGNAMLCIAGGVLTAGLASGNIVPLKQFTYAAQGAEFAAAFRVNGDIPQYIAIAQ